MLKDEQFYNHLVIFIKSISVTNYDIRRLSKQLFPTCNEATSEVQFIVDSPNLTKFFFTVLSSSLLFTNLSLFSLFILIWTTVNVFDFNFAFVCTFLLEFASVPTFLLSFKPILILLILYLLSANYFFVTLLCILILHFDLSFYFACFYYTFHFYSVLVYCSFLLHFCFCNYFLFSFCIHSYVHFVQKILHFYLTYLIFTLHTKQRYISISKI